MSFACRSIEPEQSLGPQSEPACARKGSDGRHRCGVDVAEDRLDVCVRPGNESFVVSRTGAGIEELTERLKKLASRVVATDCSDRGILMSDPSAAAAPSARPVARARLRNDGADRSVTAEVADANKAGGELLDFHGRLTHGIGT